MGKRLSKVLYQHSQYLLSIYCPACKDLHTFAIDPNKSPCWTYNNNPERPTFRNSMDVKTGHYVAGQPQLPNCKYCNLAKEDGEESNCYHCHSFVTDGKIWFLDDCTHKLKGQTVDLSPIPDWLGR